MISKEIFKASADAFGIEALRIIDKVRWHPAYMYGETTEASMLVSIPFSKKYTRKVRELNLLKMNRDANIDLSNFIYTNQQVDTLPKVLYPRGSYTSITNYVLKNFNYPEMAIKYAIQGIVGVEFIIEPRGYVSNVRIYHQLGAGCDVEVAKWINQLYFKPAIKEGKLVRVKMRVEVPIHASKSILQVH